jgi:malonyl-CoA/methylmalonyl-CoA synthetase
MRDAYADNHLAAALRAGSRGRDDAVFAETLDGRRLDYGALFAGAERMAAALRRAGVVPGDRVAAQVDKSLEALQLYLATVIAGGAFLPLNTAYTDSEIDYFLGDAEPSVFVCSPARRGALAPLAERAGARAVFDLGGDGAGTLADAVAAEGAGMAPMRRDPDDLAGILYTSGTTGRPKGAMMTHANLASNAAALAELWRFSARDRLLHALPIFHTHGLFVATNVTLIAGGSLIFLPKFDADAVMEALPRATAMMGVPTFYTRLLDRPGLAEAAKGMRLFISGSAPLLEETHRRWEEVTGHAILERYGMTETNMITSNPHDGHRRAGTVGFPLPGVSIRVAGPEGEALPDGEVGVVEVKGPNVFKGYWRMPEKTREEFRADGWFITGDLGRIDEQGYLSIVGRAKDLVISGGFNVYPKEVESAIDALPGVLESAVVGVPHPDLGEGVLAVVVPEPGATLDAATVLQGVASGSGAVQAAPPRGLRGCAAAQRHGQGPEGGVKEAARGGVPGGLIRKRIASRPRLSGQGDPAPHRLTAKPGQPNRGQAAGRAPSSGRRPPRSRRHTRRRERRNPAHRVDKLVLRRGQRDAQMAGGGGAEALAGHAGDMLGLQQGAGEVDAAQAGRGDVEHQIHAARRPARRDAIGAGQRGKRGVAAGAVARGDGGLGGVVLGQGVQRGVHDEAGDAIGAGVGQIAEQRGHLRRRDHPAAAPAGHGVGFGERADHQRALAQPGAGAQADMLALIDLALIEFVGNHPEVARAAHRGDVLQQRAVIDGAGGVVGRVEQDGAGAGGGRGGVDVGGVGREAALRAGRHEDGLGGAGAHGQREIGVPGVDQQAAVAGVERGLHGGEQTGLPAGDDDDLLGGGVDAGARRDAPGDGLAQRRRAEDGGVAEIAPARAPLHRVDDGGRGRDVMVADGEVDDGAPSACIARAR